MVAFIRASDTINLAKEKPRREKSRKSQSDFPCFEPGRNWVRDFVCVYSGVAI